MSGSTPDVRELLSPEGILLPFEIASPADRAAALFVDLVIVHAGLLLVWLMALLFGHAGFGGHAVALFFLVSFVLRNAYFPWCEIRYGGYTPGKKLLRLRVLARDGGALSAEGVLARNLTRDFEVFLPVAALAQPDALLPGMPGWAALIGLVWLLAGSLLPFFNRDHLRLGDLLGGTIVVRVPAAKLLADMADAPAGETAGEAGAAPSETYAFTPEQLDVYGIEELQVLEQILRRGPAGEGALIGRAVARRIQAKIGWAGEESDERAWVFLASFYRQQRARLEHKVLFGVRQQHKRAGKLHRPAVRKAEAAPAAPSLPEPGAARPHDAPPEAGDGAPPPPET